MNNQRYLKDKKGINTILASLLMVVIVVVAAVMVYAWSTGLLGTLLVKPNTGEGPLSPDSSAFSSTTNVTIYIRNSGSSNVTLAAYYVTDSSSNTWQLLNWAGPTIAPNKAVATNVLIGIGCSSCQYTGTTGAFSTFNSGYSYTVKVVTVKNNPFTFTVTKG
jgi:flagellin-like protein